MSTPSALENSTAKIWRLDFWLLRSFLQLCLCLLLPKWTLQGQWKQVLRGWKRRIKRLWCLLLSWFIHQFFLHFFFLWWTLIKLFSLQARGFWTFFLSFLSFLLISSQQLLDHWLSFIFPLPTFSFLQPLPALFSSFINEPVSLPQGL